MPAPAQHPDLPPRPDAPLVRTEGGRRTLEFRPGDVQSDMLLARPDALVLDYTRAMMCFALLAPRPRHIAMVGLGGGSLAKFCYRYFPGARITVLEVRADVIALREQFLVPPDDARLRVLHCDAFDYLAVAPNDIDVLLVDGFDSAGLPGLLRSDAFYAHCRRALRPGGVMVANIFTYDAGYAEAVARLRACFDGQLAWLRGVAGNNRILVTQVAAARGTRPFAGLMQRGAIGWGWSNRVLVRLLIAWLMRRSV